MQQFSKTLLLLATVVMFVFGAKAQDTAKFKPSGKVYGYAFGDYYFKVHNDSLNRGNTQYANMPKNANSFEARRIYLGYEYNISEKFTTDVLLSYEGQTLSDNLTRTIFVKAANVKWKGIFKNADLIIGLSSTPSFSNSSEKVWGYRSIEKTIADMRRVEGSSDFGVALQGKFNSNGTMGYHFMVGNGSGTRIEADRFKKFYGDIWFRFLDKKLLLDLFASYEPTNIMPDLHQSKSTYKVTVGYQTESFAIGLEAFTNVYVKASSYETFTDTVATVNLADMSSFGVSLFGRGVIKKDKLAAFARIDLFDPNTKFDKDLAYKSGAGSVAEAFVTLGLDFSPVKNVHIMPNLWLNSYASKVDGAEGKVKSDYDLVPRITFYYIYR